MGIFDGDGHLHVIRCPRACIVFPLPLPTLTRSRGRVIETSSHWTNGSRVLSELVHGLEIYDVRRESAVHLAEDHAPSAGVAAPNGRLYLMGDGGAVGPPPAVFVQPFPHHHGGGKEHFVIASHGAAAELTPKEGDTFSYEGPSSSHGRAEREISVLALLSC